MCYCLQKTTCSHWEWIFLPVCQSFSEIRCSRISFYIPTPALIPARLLPTFLFGPPPVSDGVRKTVLLIWSPLVQIQSMLIWPRGKNDTLADLSIEMDILSASQCCPSRDNYIEKCCRIWHRNWSQNCSWSLYQRTHSQTSFSAVR